MRSQVAVGVNLKLKATLIWSKFMEGVRYDSNVVYNISNLYDDRSVLILRV